MLTLAIRPSASSTDLIWGKFTYFLLWLGLQLKNTSGWVQKNPGVFPVDRNKLLASVLQGKIAR
jgi:hypothetical protein